jgi:hypothetical protein
VPTVTFDVLCVFVVLSLDRRRVLHVNVTASPYAEWAAQQVVEAFSEDATFTFLVRDRDGIFGAAFDRRVNSLGIRQLRMAPLSSLAPDILTHASTRALVGLLGIGRRERRLAHLERSLARGPLHDHGAVGAMHVRENRG